jgi:catecholate siderophore receptor
MPGTSRSGYYGFRNLDKQDSNVDQATAIFEHELSSKISLRNLTRYQDVEQYSIADGPEGTFCLPTSLTAAGLACTTPGLFTPSGGSRGNTRDTRNQIIYNQTDLKGTFETFGIEHSFDLGISLSREYYDVRSGNSQRNANGTAVTIPAYAWNDPNLNNRNVDSGPVNFIVSARSHSEVANKAVYLFDTMKLSNHFELNGGVRWERNIGEFAAYTLSTAAATLGQITAVTRTGNRNSLLSYRVGAVYKPIEPISLYVAYGNSRTPSQSTVNGSCSAATCNVKPESAKNYEIGGKAELFKGGLLLTAANEVTKALSLQLNVKNIGDKLYYTRIRANNGWATPGDARSAILTASYKF